LDGPPPQSLAPVLFPGHPCSAGERGTESSRGVFSGSLRRRSHRTSSSPTSHDCLPRAKPLEKSVERNSQTQTPSALPSDPAKSICCSSAVFLNPKTLESHRFSSPHAPHLDHLASFESESHTTTPRRTNLPRTRRQLSRVRPSPFLPVSTMGHA
jgi:hypothetical protein